MRESVRRHGVAAIVASGWKRSIAACAITAILVTIAYGSLPGETAPPKAGADVKALAQATNAFAQDLSAQLPRTGNLVFSPYSISTAMALALSGARGTTEEELLRVLRHQLMRGEVDAANTAMHRILAHYGARASWWTPGPVRLAAANAVMLTPSGGDIISKAYLAAVERSYDAKVFRNGSASAVNSWVRQKTDGKIETLVDQLPPGTQAILLNAIYFKAAWHRSFDASLTRADAFEKASGEKVLVPLMHREGDYPVATGEGYSAIRLPYQNAHLSMVVVLPDERHGNEAISARLDGTALSQLFAQLRQEARPVRLALPRFKIRFAATLQPPLRALGLSRPFDPAQADFSGMTGGVKALWLADVRHAAVIEVAEEGTEAAATTGVFMVTSYQPPVDFRVTRPFLFYIVDDASEAILFQGRVVDPRG
jgi:serpin B